MNNKMVLAILSVYAFILCCVFFFYYYSSKSNISAPSTSENVVVEDRLDSAVVLYENSPVILVNKAQTLINKNDASMVPIIENQNVYVPASFFQTAYKATTSEDLSACSATIRLDNQALVLDRSKADLVDSNKEKDIEYNNRVFIKNGCIYVPLEVFAKAFNKSIHYYDNLTIISDMHNVFTDAENTDFINSLKSQVNDLPYVATEENMKEIARFSTANNILKQIGNTNKTTEIPPVQLLQNRDSNNIKSISNYIFYANNNKIYVLDTASNSEITTKTIELEQNFNCEKIYIQNNLLVAVGTSSYEENNSQSTLYAFDITNKQDIKKLREIKIDGYYTNSIQNGNFIYTLINCPISSLSSNGKFYPPVYIDSLNNYNKKSLDYENMQYFPEGSSTNYMIVYSFNLSDINFHPEVKSYLGAGDNVYMSNNNVYIAKNRYNAFSSNENIENTFIYRLSLLNGKIYMSGKGNVQGYLVDKNSMNEYSGYFRLATQYKKKGINKNVTNVYILNNNLEICGFANEIVSGVETGGAIFDKNKLFISPSKKGQALYSVDLTEPTNPRGNGILKLSSGNLLIYMYDENHIITIDNGNDKLSISLYDISDKDNPVLKYKQELGQGNIETNLFKDNSSFFFDKEKNTFTIPVTIYENQEKKNQTFNGGYVYKVNLDDGFERIGVLSLPNSDAQIHTFKQNGFKYTFMSNNLIVSDTDNLENVKEYSIY